MSLNSEIVPMLTALNRIPGWMGTLVLNPDGSILQSAGQLINYNEVAYHCAAMANRIGRLLNLETGNITPEFKRVTIHARKYIYILTCVGDTIYLVKCSTEDESDNHSTDSSHSFMTENLA